MKCPFCGFERLKPEYKFCPKCRRPLTDRQSEPANTEIPVNGDEKGFLARMMMPYSKAIADPVKYGEWARKNPNDRKKLWSKWQKEGYDLTPLMKYNPDYAQVLETAVEQVRAGEPITGIRETDSTEQPSGQSAKPSTSHSTSAGPAAAQPAASATASNPAGRANTPVADSRRPATSHPGLTRFANESGQLVQHKAIWSVAPGEVARNLSPAEFLDVAGQLDGVVIQEGVTAIVYVDGIDVAELDSGLYVFASERDFEQAREHVAREDKDQEKYGLRKIISSVWRFLSGKKQGDTAAKVEERKKRVTQVVRSITSQSTISIYLKMNKILSLPFGISEVNGQVQFTPYKLKTRILDMEAAVTLQVKIGNFKEFIANYLTDRGSATYSDLQKSINGPLQNILSYQFRTAEIDEYGLQEADESNIREKIMNINRLLHGIEIVMVESITTDNHDFDRIRKATGELYLSEKELDLLHRTNNFKNRLASETNEQKIHEAKTDLELKKVLDEINKDSILHEDELEKFHALLKNQRQIRNATQQYELEKALSEIKYNSLVTKDEYEELVLALEDKKFDRSQVSQVMRLQSLSRTALAQLELNSKLSSAKLDAETEDRKRRISSQMELDDAGFEAFKRKMGRDADTVDLEAAIYGRKYVVEKQQMLDQMALQALKADHQKEMLEKEIAQKETIENYEETRDERRYQTTIRREDQKFETDLSREQRRFDADLNQEERQWELDRQKSEWSEERERERRNEEAERRKEEYERENQKADTAFQQQRQSKMDDLEILRQKARIAAENMQLMQEAEKQKQLHEENIHAMDTDVKKAEINAKANMTADQLMAEQAASLDKDAQKAFADNLGSKKILEERERQSQLDEQRRLEEKEEMHRRENMQREDQIRREQQMKEMMEMMRDMATTSMNTSAAVATGTNQQMREFQQAAMDSSVRIATSRLEETQAQKEEYRQQMQQQQQRTDNIQDRALNYTTRLSETDSKFHTSAQQSAPAPAPAPAPQETKNTEYYLPDFGQSLPMMQMITAIEEGIVKPDTIIRKDGQDKEAIDYQEFYEAVEKRYGTVCQVCGTPGIKGTGCPTCGNEIK